MYFTKIVNRIGNNKQWVSSYFDSKIIKFYVSALLQRQHENVHNINLLEATGEP